MKISSRRWVDCVKTLHQKACHTCSTNIFLVQPIKSLALPSPLPSSLLGDDGDNEDDKSDDDDENKSEHGDDVEDGYQSTSMSFEPLFFSYF